MCALCSTWHVIDLPAIYLFLAQNWKLKHTHTNILLCGGWWLPSRHHHPKLISACIHPFTIPLIYLYIYGAWHRCVWPDHCCGSAVMTMAAISLWTTHAHAGNNNYCLHCHIEVVGIVGQGQYTFCTNTFCLWRLFVSAHVVHFECPARLFNGNNNV